MKKRKINIILITSDKKEEYKLLGEYNPEKNIISYQESGDLLTEVVLDLNQNILIRENKDYYLQYKFIENEETENEMKLKDLNQSIKLKIKTEKFNVTNNKIEIIYTLLDSNETINYQINY